MDVDVGWKRVPSFHGWSRFRLLVAKLEIIARKREREKIVSRKNEPRRGELLSSILGWKSFAS